ncbi:unnamed protein product [marine sediment metagenome]|uniref:Uncharacterized protein n=1 Tax=marine sediment metagenome TaxID=412755 RepID=X0SPQ1_9ZZZZ
MAFWIGFLCGVIATLITAPFLIKWYIRKKLKNLTGGLFK